MKKEKYYKPSKLAIITIKILYYIGFIMQKTINYIVKVVIKK